MPCYCDIPDSSDQKEIEKRCKVNMYFEAQGLLTKEQVEECSKIHINLYPIGDVNSHLCKLCKVLTNEQMEEISAYYYEIKWKHKTLLDWHIQHCKDDLINNEK